MVFSHCDSPLPFLQVIFKGLNDLNLGHASHFHTIILMVMKNIGRKTYKANSQKHYLKTWTLPTKKLHVWAISSGQPPWRIYFICMFRIKAHSDRPLWLEARGALCRHEVRHEPGTVVGCAHTELVRVYTGMVVVAVSQEKQVPKVPRRTKLRGPQWHVSELFPN